MNGPGGQACLAPRFLVATFTIEGWLRPGYDAFGMFISALSLGPRGLVQIVNFLLLGALFLVFARGMAAELRADGASRVGPTLLTVIGIAFFASGPFVMDPVNAITHVAPRDQMTLHGTLHGILGGLVFSLSPVSCFVFWRRFRVDPKWRALRWWTFAAGTIVGSFVMLLTLATKPPFAPNALTPWVGLIQRLALVPYLAWTASVAVVLLRRS